MSTRSVLATAAIGVAILSGCSPTSPPTSEHPAGLTVAASTDVWASVVKAVAGDHATVNAIIKGADTDPHSFEVTPVEAAEIQDASLVVYNGGNYDPFVDKLLKPGQPRVNAYSLLPPGATDANEHVFYRLATVAAVADQVATELAKADPGDADTFHANAKTFQQQIDSVATIEHSIAAHRGGTAIVATEPVAHYLVEESGLVDRTPHGFAEASENDTDPAPADIAATLDLITTKKVAALLFNPQTSGPVANQVKQTASTAGLPIVTVTETLPAGTDYLTWQRQTAEQLAAAVGA